MIPEDISKRARERSDLLRLRLDVKRTKEGSFVLPTFKNVEIYLTSDENLMNLFQYNDFSSFVELTRQPPWNQTIGLYPKNADDFDILGLKSYLIQTYSVECTLNVLNEAVSHSAKLRSYDPVKKYLESLKWDGVKRVDQWLIKYLHVEDSEYSRFVGTMTLNAACARIDRPGVKYDYMLILEGEQNIGKSLAVSTLGGQYFREISLMDRTKETVENMQGAWIIEVAELAVFKKRDIESLKSFVSNEKDSVRLPFGRRTQTFPRRNIFVGTINPDNNGYLCDTTGNRRFLPVECRGYVDIAGIQRDRDQIWAEAWSIYRKGFPLRIPIESTVADAAFSAQTGRQTADEWQNLIHEYIQGKQSVRGVDIWTECLKGFASEFDRTRQLRVSDCMKRMGWSYRIIRLNGKTARCYCSPTFNEAENTENQKPWDGKDD